MQNQKQAYFKSLSDIERATALKENAVSAYTKNVVRDFTEEDLDEMKSRLSEVDIELNDTEIEKKELTQEINGRIKIFKTRRSELLRDLKNKYFESNETVYDIDNQEDGVMETYDHAGNLIGTRKLSPKERQTTIKNLNAKTA